MNIAAKAPQDSTGKLDDYAREVQAIRDRTASLEAEAASLILVAGSGKEYGAALDYARKRAELLHAAQKAGKALTPELVAEIDALAQAYVTAGLAAEDAAEKMGRIKEQSERGKDAMQDMFGAIIDGSKSAGDAVADLLREIAKAQMIKGIMGLPGMGALAGTVGGLLGFDEGGYTGNRPADEVAGFVHGGEYVFSAAAVKRLGVGALEGLHRQGQRGFASGGPVGMSASAPLAGNAAPKVEVHIHENASDGATQVRQSPGRIDVDVRKGVADMVRSGGLDAAFGQRFGIRPKSAGG